jgi:uncharacterized protein (DUF58 family)
MEALNLLLNLLLAMLVLLAARAVVLAIWMIILIILGEVGRMVDFLWTRFENEVKLTKSTVDERSRISVVLSLPRSILAYRTATVSRLSFWLVLRTRSNFQTRQSMSGAVSLRPKH